MYILNTDPVLLGSDVVTRNERPGVLLFHSGNLSEMLCIDSSESERDEDACEPDITGVVRLMNSSDELYTEEPSVATVSIKDDDRM